MKKLIIYDPATGVITQIITGPISQPLVDMKNFPGMQSITVDGKLPVSLSDTVKDGALVKAA